MSEVEIRERLQARVPNLNISHDPGGVWNWMIGMIAVVGSIAVLGLASRGRRARGSSPRAIPDVDDDDEWSHVLDEELVDVD